MLDIELIRRNPNQVKQGAKYKGVDIDIDKVLKLDKQRRELIQRAEGLKAEKNKLGAKERDKAKKIKREIKKVEPELEKNEQEFNQLMVQIPNLPLGGVPVGKTEKDNKVVRKQGNAKKSGKNYLEISEKLDIIDVKRAAKVSGTRFGYFRIWKIASLVATSAYAELVISISTKRTESFTTNSNFPALQRTR